jgi:hypothetical protein
MPQLICFVGFLVCDFGAGLQWNQVQPRIDKGIDFFSLSL